MLSKGNLIRSSHCKTDTCAWPGILQAEHKLYKCVSLDEKEKNRSLHGSCPEREQWHAASTHYNALCTACFDKTFHPPKGGGETESKR